MIQIKDSERKVADSLVAYLRLNQLDISDRLSFFGAVAPLNRLKQIVPASKTHGPARSVQRAASWAMSIPVGLATLPRACDDGVVIIPVDQADLLWGWPNRFLARMRAHHTQVMLIGRVDGLTSGNFTRLDTVADLSRVPAGFDGLIWTDQIRVVGAGIANAEEYSSSLALKGHSARAKNAVVLLIFLMHRKFNKHARRMQLAYGVSLTRPC